MTLQRGRTLAIVQARMSSSRLPGKVLMPLESQTMILRQLERVARAATLDEIVVATSVDSHDDELARIVSNAGYPVVRGSLDDVLARYIKVIDTYQPDVVVRITADCPLIDPEVIDYVVTQFHGGSSDYVSNTMTPTYPDGLDVEVVTPEALKFVDQHSKDPHEREHVTLGVYRRADTFTITNVIDPSGANNSALRWTVDNADDYTFVTKVYGELFPTNPFFSYADVLRFLDDRPELSRSERDAQRNVALNDLDTGAMRHGGSGV